MSGITGAWNLDEQPMSAGLISSMSGRLRHRGRDGERARIDGATGFACQHNWVTPEEQGVHQPLVAASRTMLVMDGRIDNREELIDALGVSNHVSDAHLVLAAYQAWIDRFAERLNGDFAIAIFDPARRRLVLARDAIGVRPLYYVHTSRLFAFASEIKALLAHPDIPARPNDEGVADFMLVGSRPLDRQDLTCFQDISSVVPAHLIVVTPDHVTRTRYWDFDTEKRVRFGSFEEYVEAFRGHFVEAVKRRTRSAFPVSTSISGGLDSSSIFCQAETLRRAGAVPASSVVGVSYISDRVETDEQHYLREIEMQYAVTFDRFHIEPLTGLTAGAEEQIAATEAPFVDYLWGVTRELHTRAAATGARALLSGHWGDQMLFSSAYLTDLLRRGALRSIWRHTRMYGRYLHESETWLRRRLLLVDALRYAVPRFAVPPLKWIRQRFARDNQPKEWFSSAFLTEALKYRYRLATFDRPFHSAHARGVYLEARSKYQVQCLEWNNKACALRGLDVAFPFLDRDLIGFLMAIPGDVHARDGVPRVLLREAMRGTIPDAICARTWKSDFSIFVNTGLSQDAATILRTLHRDCLGVRFGYLDSARLAPELASLATQLTAPDCVAGWDLADTYGLEMWLRVFLQPSRGAIAQPLP